MREVLVEFDGERDLWSVRSAPNNDQGSGLMSMARRAIVFRCGDRWRFDLM